jgi:fructose transport system substrate-binding protein
VKGILITPSNDDVGPALKAARAAGILVISLDTPLGDAEAQDMTFATDNFQAGVLIGKWAKAQLGDKAATPRSPCSTSTRTTSRLTCCATRAS